MHKRECTTSFATMLQAGIVGLPNVGKSTLFNALTRTRKAESANYPFCTIDPNIGVVQVPDARLEPLRKIAKTDKVIDSEKTDRKSILDTLAHNSAELVKLTFEALPNKSVLIDLGIEFKPLNAVVATE